MRSVSEIVADCRSAVGNYDRAALQGFISEFASIDDDVARACTTFYRGVAARLESDLPTALTLLEQAVLELEHVNRPSMVASSLNELAIVSTDMGQLDAALEYALRSLEAARGLNLTEGIAISTATIGTIYDHRGEYHHALECYRQCVTYFTEIEMPLAAAKCEFNVAVVLSCIGEFDESLRSLERAVEIYRGVDYHVGVARAQCAAAMVHHQSGDYPRALAIMMSVMDLVKEYCTATDLAHAYSNVGLIYNGAGLHDRSLEWLIAALELFTTLGQRNYAVQTELLIGGSYWDKGDAVAAVSHLEHAREQSAALGLHWLEAATLRQLCGVALDTQHWDDAQRYALMLSEREITRPDTLGWHQLNCARIEMHLGDHAAAERHLHAAHAVFIEHGYRAYEVEVLLQFRELAVLKKDFNSYIEYNATYLKLREEVRGTQVQHRFAILSMEREIELERHERELEQLKNERLETSYQRQQQLLSMYAANLVRQTELVDEMRASILTMIKQSITPDGAVEAIRDRLAERPTAESNWQRFYRQFVEVHPDVEPNLRTRIPTISATELKVCCLLLMGMNTRDIATLLFVSERTIDIHRGNIRKKLELDRSKDLRSALAVIASP